MIEVCHVFFFQFRHVTVPFSRDHIMQKNWNSKCISKVGSDSDAVGQLTNWLTKNQNGRKWHQRESWDRSSSNSIKYIKVWPSEDVYQTFSGDFLGSAFWRFFIVVFFSLDDHLRPKMTEPMVRYWPVLSRFDLRPGPESPGRYSSWIFISSKKWIFNMMFIL